MKACLYIQNTRDSDFVYGTELVALIIKQNEAPS